MESQEENTATPTTRSILLYGSIGIIASIGLSALFALTKSAVDEIFGVDSEGAQIFFWTFSTIFIGSLISTIIIILKKFGKELFRGK